MHRLSHFLMTLVVLLGLAFAQAPSPCAGDGHGEACLTEACACDASCTCRAAHADADVPECCRVEPADTPTGLSQATPHRWPNFTPPMKRWFALPVSLEARLEAAPALQATPWRRVRPAGLATAPPDKVPRRPSC
jgi:hypothetical protein